MLAMRASPFFTNPVIDAATYDDAARAIAAGHGHPDVIFWQPPGYSYFLAFIYSVAGPGYLAPRIAQALLGAGSAVLTAWIGARSFGRGVGLFAGYGVALYGMLVYYDGELLTPTLTIALQLAAIALALMARDHPRREGLLWGNYVEISWPHVGHVRLGESAPSPIGGETVGSNPLGVPHLGH